MTGIVLLIIGSFILGALVGFFGALFVTASAIVNNTRGVRDLVEAQIAKSKKLDRTETAMKEFLEGVRNRTK